MQKSGPFVSDWSTVAWHFFFLYFCCIYGVWADGCRHPFPCMCVCEGCTGTVLLTRKKIYLNHVCQAPSTQTPTSSCTNSLSQTRQGRAEVVAALLHSVSPTKHPSVLNIKITVTNGPRSQHSFWPYSAAAAAYFRTASYLEGCKIRGNLPTEHILSWVCNEDGCCLKMCAGIDCYLKCVAAQQCCSPSPFLQRLLTRLRLVQAALLCWNN